MDFQQKIDKVLTVSKVKLWKLAEESGLGTTLEKAYNQNREMREAKTEQLLQNLGISKEWWDNPSKPLVLKGKNKYTDGGKIPFYDATVVGGMSILADQTPISEPTEMIDPGTFLRQATGTLRVYGDSMYPKYPGGSVVAFKPTSTSVIIWGEDYVLELADRRIVKRLEKSAEGKDYVKAVSYNINKDGKYIYDPTDIPMTEIKRLFMVLGRVVIEASI